MQIGAGSRTLSWTPRMAGVSVVLERDIPDVIVRRENEVSREVRKVDLKNLRWPKPPGSAQDLKRKNGPGKEGGAAQERPEPAVKINPMNESTVTITRVPDETNKVVGEVTNLLKGLNGAVLKSVKHGGAHLEVESDEGTRLLDGGATPPLRQGSTEEIKNAVQVTVELAHGATQLYQNPVNGTLLSEGPVEPIVSLRGLVELGYTITWSRAGCVVKHPRLGNIECWLRSGCPVVRKDHALALITEIEHMEMEKRTNHRLTLEEPTEKTKKWWGSRFPETPERIWNYMRGQDEEDPQMNHDLPWNRHKRRRLLTSIKGPDNPTNKQQKKGKDSMGKAGKRKEMVKDWCGASCVWKIKYGWLICIQIEGQLDKQYWTH